MTDQEILNVNLIAHLELANLTDEQKLQLLNDMATLVQKRAMAQIIEVLSDSQREQLTLLIEKEGVESEELGSFLRNAVPTIDDIYKQELIAVKRELIEKAAEIAP